MKNFIEKLFSSPLGMILFYLGSLMITVYPILMFDMPFILYILLVLVFYIFLSKRPFAIEILWVIGLVGAVMGKQDAFAIIYYILFAIIIGRLIYKFIPLIVELIRGNRT